MGKNIAIITVGGNMKTYIYILFLALSILFTISCSRSADSEPDAKVRVIVSILPQKAFVNAVGGDLVEVSSLIPPGGSPASYEPLPGDLIKLEKADIYFRIGHIPFERSHLEKFRNLNPELKIVDTSRYLELRFFGDHEEHSHAVEEHVHESDVDPHIWLSPPLVKQQIDVIAAALCEFDSLHKNIYRHNAEDFKNELDALDDELNGLINNLPTKKLLVFHPAWGYFADRYGLQQIAIEQDGKEPTAAHLQHFIHDARQHKVKVIFVQSQFNRRIADSIAGEIGAVVVSIDPLAEDYLDNLKHIAYTIAEHLQEP